MANVGSGCYSCCYLLVKEFILMYDIIMAIIGYSASQQYDIRSYVLAICGALIIVFATVMIDLVYKIIFALINKIK